MRNIGKRELKLKFVEVLNQTDGFIYEDGNPFLINIENVKYFLFLKNISSAYFKKSPDVTRVQLPTSDHFKIISQSDIPFIIFGFDIDNDAVVCWNPSKVKSRLNEKSNVSLYSRESLQSNTKLNEFKLGYLTNGEKIILFKRENLPLFFEKLPTLFNDISNKLIRSDINEGDISVKLSEVTDKELLSKIEPLLRKNRVLEAVEICSKYYGDKHKGMSFKDWFKIVNALYQKIQRNNSLA